MCEPSIWHQAVLFAGAADLVAKGSKSGLNLFETDVRPDGTYKSVMYAGLRQQK